MSCHHPLGDKLERRKGTHSWLHVLWSAFACCIQSISPGLRARNLSSILKGNTPPAREHHHTGMWIYTLRTPFN